jgi:hypothetical protein
VLVGVGLSYNRYTAAPAWSSAVDFGFQIGGSPLISISSLILQPKTASIQTALGYDLKKQGPVHVIALASLGVASSSTAPAVSVGTVNLGTLGGGLLVRYDLGHLHKSLAGLGLAAGVRETAIAGSNVAPEFLLKLNYYLK